MSAKISLATVALFAAAAPVAGADWQQSTPLWVDNLSPVAALVALPGTRSARIASGWQLDVHTAIASHWVLQDSARESVFFDGETLRLTTAAEYGFNDSWSMSVAVPFTRHSEGFLDGVINPWHDFFGMSDGGRSRYPDDQLRFAVDSPLGARTLSRPGSGLGDIRAAVNVSAWRSNDAESTVSLGYKWATGDERTWLGSGAGDWFVSARFSGRQLSELPLTWHGQVGYTYAGQSDLLGPEQQRHLWRAGLGVDWRLTRALSLLAQVDGHSALLDSTVDALGDPSVMLSVGARWYASPSWSLTASFIEDIQVESAPDITFQMTLQWRPQSE